MRFLAALTALVAAVTALPTDAENTLEARQARRQSYIDRVLLHHNVHRQNHSAPNLVWDTNLAASAKNLALKCEFKHNTTIGPASNYGQNLAVGVRFENITISITNLWYNNEINKYPGPYGGEPSMARFGDWGHYSQVVWANTRRVGCYTSNTQCRSVAGAAGIPPFLTVCNYSPPGNYRTQFGRNVGRPLGRPTVNSQWGLY